MLLSDKIVTGIGITVRALVPIKDNARVMDNGVGEENRDAVLESLKVPITVLSIMETSIP